MPLTRKQIHEQVYFYTLILIAVSLPLSIFTTSMFQLVLLLNWLVELRYREKWQKVVSNRALQLFLLIFGLHLVGLLWSSNLAYALHDIKIKLPLLAFPVIIATSFTKAMLTSRWAFSIALAASAVLMSGARWTPAAQIVS